MALWCDQLAYRKVQGDDMDAVGHEHVQSFLCIPAAPAVAVAVDDDRKAVLTGDRTLLRLVVAALQLEASLAHLVRQALIFRPSQNASRGDYLHVFLVFRTEELDRIVWFSMERVSSPK